MGLVKNEISIQEGLDRYDRIDRNITVKLLPQLFKGVHTVIEHPNKYSVDLISYNKHGNPIAYIEVETSTIWKSHQFPWKKLHFLEERKGRYLYKKPYTDLEFVFIMYNADKTSCMMVTRELILKSPIEEKVSTWKGRESFRVIDKNKALYVNLSDYDL